MPLSLYLSAISNLIVDGIIQSIVFIRAEKSDEISQIPLLFLL